MQRLLVYADFDWLKEIELIGTLSYEKLRGSDSYGFEFHSEWLRNHTSIQISADINNYPGPQYTQPGKEIFGCFSDALPDRWGRTLINKREQILALEEKRPLRKLSSFDYLTGIDDFSRMGGLRFKWDQESDYLNKSSSFNVPPITDLRTLIHASQEIEKSEIELVLPDKKWIAQLLQPGTSLGGARPKASVSDEYRNLYIAKFPSINDTYDVGLWEHLCNLLAKSAGIHTAPSKAINMGGRYHTYLSKRFDRSPANKRIHFASAMTLLGFEDGDNATSGKGYPDIVDFIVRGCTDVHSNLEELFRRVLFNIFVGNSDDHFRNHGFLLTPRGWTLSPVYDVNPTLDEHQSLLISSNSNESNPDILLDASEEYLIDRKRADQILHQVRGSLNSWEKVAKRLQIPEQELSIFRFRFNKHL